MSDFWETHIKPYTQARLFALPPVETALDLLATAAQAVQRARRLDEIGTPDAQTLLSEIVLIGAAIDQAAQCLQHTLEEK